MDLFRHLSLAICLLAVPAAADPAQDYARLREAMPGLSLDTDVGQQLRQTVELIQRLQGRWVQVSALMGGETTFPDADLLARACERNGQELAADGNLGLTLTTPAEPQPARVSLRYVGGTTFLGTFDEAGMLARMFPGKTFDEIDPQMLHSVLVGNPWAGYMSLLPVGEDLILLQPLGRPAELLARCP